MRTCICFLYTLYLGSTQIIFLQMLEDSARTRTSIWLFCGQSELATVIDDAVMKGEGIQGVQGVSRLVDHPCRESLDTSGPSK